MAKLTSSILALALTLFAAQGVQAKTGSAASDQLVTVWENVWQSSGSVQVAKADRPAPSYDDTQWSVPTIGSGGCCQQGGGGCSQIDQLDNVSCSTGSFFPGASCDAEYGCITEQPVCCQGMYTGLCVSNINLTGRGVGEDCTVECLGDYECGGGFCDHGNYCKTGSTALCTDTIHPQKCFLLGGQPIADSACQTNDGHYCGGPEPSDNPFCCACNGPQPFGAACFEAGDNSACQLAGCQAVENAACDPITEGCIPLGCQTAGDCDDNVACTVDSCDHDDPLSDEDGCVFTATVCTNGLACDGDETCDEGTGNCVPGASVLCSDGDVCNGVEECSEADNASCSFDATDLNCTDNNSCTINSCDEVDGCQVDFANDNTSCSDNSSCTSGTTCQPGGICGGGSTITCDDGSACTADSCDSGSGCVFDIVVETPACGSCDDGLDNDDDGDADGEDCDCATLCAQQRFAVVTTFVPTNFKRYAFYSGSDVAVESSPNSVPYPSGGICITNGDYRAGANMAFLATTGSSRFGKGAAIDPDLVEEGDDDIDTGSDRVSIFRESFDSDGNPELIKDSPPYVGPGVCNNAPTSCVADADCGVGNDCTNQLTLTDVNPNVTRNGLAENYTRCVTAQATVDPEAAQIAAIAGNVSALIDNTPPLVALTDGDVKIKTSKSNTAKIIQVGGGLQVINVRLLILSGKTTLTFRRDPLAVDPTPTTLVIRVARQIRLGGEAEILLDGIDEDRVIWNAEGPTGGRPRLSRSAKFVGTLIASERRGIQVGGLVEVRGALKGRRIKIGQSSTITHVPSKVLLP